MMQMSGIYNRAAFDFLALSTPPVGNRVYMPGILNKFSKKVGPIVDIWKMLLLTYIHVMGLIENVLDAMSLTQIYKPIGQIVI